MSNEAVEIVLTSGTYGLDTTNRILSISHAEQEWSQVAQVFIENRDGNLTSLTMEGEGGVVTWTTNDGSTARAPLTVIAQKADHLQGDLVVSLSLAGLFNLWSEQEATEAYAPDDTNGDKVKTLLDKIAGATLNCFSSYPSHTITYDSGYDDSIINAFTPKDYFSVSKRESRLAAFKKVLAYTKCKASVENDAGTATIHIFQPTLSGTGTEFTNTTFYEKSVRTRLVLPNKVIVRSHPDHTPQYTGNATDAASYASLGNQYYTETHHIRAASNAQCTLIATAILQGYQLATEVGHGISIMDVTLDVLDRVTITDDWASDAIAGNIGYENRRYSYYDREPTRFGFEFRFGTLDLPGLAGTMPPRSIDPFTQDIRQGYGDLFMGLGAVESSLTQLIDNQRNIVDYLTAIQEYIWKLHVGGQFILPVWIPGAPMVTTEAITDIAATTATGNLTIIDLGVPDPTAHGVCWDTSSSPTTSDSTTDEGAATATGAVTTDMTSLSASTLYYVRAYATNSEGTSYGVQVTFTTTA